MSVVVQRHEVQSLEPSPGRAAKRGELLVYRPRREDAVGGPAAEAADIPEKPPAVEPLVLIRCCGRDFLARESMATIFLRRAQELIEAGATGLVPLLHSGGVDLLSMSPSTPFAVVSE